MENFSSKISAISSVISTEESEVLEINQKESSDEEDNLFESAKAMHTEIKHATGTQIFKNSDRYHEFRDD